MTGDKTILADSAAPYGSVNSYPTTTTTNNHVVSATSPPLTHPAATASVEPNNAGGSETVQPNIEYKEKIQALHACKYQVVQYYNIYINCIYIYIYIIFLLDQANPDDPNELSFAKGESLEIVDRNGNWWQAKKSDGSVGIIPSNYVSFFLIV